jgi:DNA polymerase III sliding clamp (beta) subunit (PCNA family)
MKNIIELPVAELKMALPGLAKIIGRKTTLPVLSAVRVARDSNGTLTLQGTDLDSTATFTLKDKSEGPATQMLVPLDRLQKAVKQTNGKVELSLSKKDEVIIRSFWRDTPMEEKIGVPYNDDWPKQVIVEAEPVKLTEHFRNTFRNAMECASEDSSRAVINSVYLDVDDKKGHYVVATDGRHLFSANSFAFDFKQSVIIPTRKFLAWTGWWTEGDATLAIKPPTKSSEITWLQFKAEQWTFLTRGQDQPFPKWKNVVPNDEYRTTITIPDQAITAVLQVLARLPGEDDYNKGVKLNASTNTLVLSGFNKEQSQTVAVPLIEAQVKGLSSVVSLNREYMIRALKFGLNEINIVDEMSPIVFKSQGRKMIVMPLRPNGGEPVKSTTTAATKPAPEAQPPTPPTPPTNQTTETTTTPPAEPTKPVQQERTTMPKTETTTNTAATTTEPQDSPLKQLIQQIETIKTTLKGVVSDLHTALDVVKKADKEKRLAEKEIEAIREKVREIQSVTI